MPTDGSAGRGTSGNDGSRAGPSGPGPGPDGQRPGPDGQRPGPDGQRPGRDGQGELTQDALLAELRRLGRGRGLNAVNLDGRIGPMLTLVIRRDEGLGFTQPPSLSTNPSPNGSSRSAANPNNGAGPNGSGVDRAMVIRWLRQRLPLLPVDLAEAAKVFFGVHREAQDRFLGERLDRLGHEWRCDRRTVRRRADEALVLIAEAAVRAPATFTSAPDAIPPARAPFDTGTPFDNREEIPPFAADASWYTERLSALVLLDRDLPEVTERRTIVATADGVETVTLELSVPPGDDHRGRGRELGAEVLYGGTLLSWDQPSPSYYRLQVALPRPLQAGERHDLDIVLRLVDGAPMAPHYMCVPLSRLAEFQIRVRFSRRQVAAGVEVFVLDGVPPRVVDDYPPRQPRLAPHRAVEVRMLFRDLRQGRGYGLRWTG
ncbi:hypothetical protein [Frankia sp. AvcI1]|uniref:hypothetical protein n=1 Tax=Frankia sp. AvcI1 TaxID=573496 RepID=UPI00211970D1|nr:hypothetical protein [Frankia sp. AvcI1]